MNTPEIKPDKTDPIPVSLAAEYLCKKSGWKLTPLQVQKLLYLANMYHLVYHGKPLVDQKFEAWIYGPVQPSLYHVLKRFGSNRVNVFPYQIGGKVTGTHKEVLDFVLKTYGHLGAGDLIEITHCDGGGWAKNWDEDYVEFGIVIPDRDIIEEFAMLTGRSADA